MKYSVLLFLGFWAIGFCDAHVEYEMVDLTQSDGSSTKSVRVVPAGSGPTWVAELATDNDAVKAYKQERQRRCGEAGGYIGAQTGRCYGDRKRPITGWLVGNEYYSMSQDEVTSLGGEIQD